MGFWLAQTEVTQAAWKKLHRGDNPSHFTGDDLPVTNIGWISAASYCMVIGGRLPTDKEWEYAARAGSTGSYYGNPDDIEWDLGNSGGIVHPVWLKQPNAFGLYDMLGNVDEWISEPAMAHGGSVTGLNEPPASVHNRMGTSMTGSFFNTGFRCADGAP